MGMVALGFWELIIGVLIPLLILVITILITWHFTNKTIRGMSEATERTIREVSEIMAKHVEEAIKAIHADIAHSQRKLEAKLQEKG